MPIPRPTRDQLADCAAHFRLTLDDADLASFGGLVDNSLGSYDAVQDLYTAQAPITPSDRGYTTVDPAENPWGAWYVRTSITGADDGPLTGKTVAIKDNIEVAGVPMMNGSRSVEGFVPSRDATVVTRLLAAGATITGKSVCEDLSFSGASHTSATGPVRNPWDPARTTGGSSSGSGALVASGAVDLALGGDQGGSVRIPGSFCGIVGLKPTYGLVPYTGAFPIEATLDHIGPMARTVRDVALMLSVLAGADGDDPRQPAGLTGGDYVSPLDQDTSGLRIGVVPQGFGIPDVSDPAVDEVVREALRRLAEAGLKVADVDVPWHRDGLHVWNVLATDGAAYQMLTGNAFGLNRLDRYDPELMAHFGKGRVRHADALSDTVKLVALCGQYSLAHLQGRHYAMARELTRTLRDAYDAALQHVDVLAMPTLPFTATPLVTLDDSRETGVSRALGMLANTSPFNATGHPAVSVPAGLVDGLPAGLMLIGRRFDDATVLRIAHAFENLVGGFPTPSAHNTEHPTRQGGTL